MSRKTLSTSSTRRQKENFTPTSTTRSSGSELRMTNAWKLWERLSNHTKICLTKWTFANKRSRKIGRNLRRLAPCCNNGNRFQTSTSKLSALAPAKKLNKRTALSRTTLILRSLTPKLCPVTKMKRNPRTYRKKILCKTSRRTKKVINPKSFKISIFWTERKWEKSNLIHSIWRRVTMNCSHTWWYSAISSWRAISSRFSTSLFCLTKVSSTRDL